MRSRTVHLSGGTPPRDMLIAAAGEAGRQPDFVLAFLPPEENLRDVLAAMTLVWPDALRFGCEPVTRAGARVFVGERVLPSACLVLTLQGIAMQVQVVRGWSPASPVYTVTRAEGSIVREIDGEPATDWYRRFFTVGGELAPMPA